jgi:phytoene synthase
MHTSWPDDIAACRAQLANGSRTFLAASLLLPRSVREPACALYAFCREADDAVDSAAREADAMAGLRERLARVYGGAPLPIAADRALAQVVERFAIPRALLEALLEGFEWDLVGRRYDDITALEQYAARVAGAVGAMMALLMGTRGATAIARACDLGVAMQLSNIARDVGEDARAGRLYLPRDWMRSAGLDPDAWLAQPRFDARLASVVQRLLGHADGLYQRAAAGVAELPIACRPSIHAARLLYADIGHEVARRGFDSVSQRAVVGSARKGVLLGQALLQAALPQQRDAAPPLAATRYLVEACAQGPGEWAAPRRTADKVVWVIALFERLERREQLRQSA